MTKSYKEIKKEKEGTDVQVQEACWVGYKQVGLKKKGDRMVPNCVKEDIVHAVFGKDYIYENVGDMYKGTFTKAQLAKMKQTWSTKKASDLTPSVKNFIKGLDQFTQMDIKGANIKYISDLIEEFEDGEVDIVNESKEIFEESELRVLVRRNEMTEGYFSASQLERLAKAYSVMKDRTISVANAQKLGKMMDGVPDSSLNAIRKKKIPFLSGLALSKMIKKKIPVTESTYEDKEEEQIVEADLSKSQIKKVHKQADDLPKKDFIKRYGKDGDSVRYATATNMVKKKLGLGEDKQFIKKGELKMNESYKQRLTSAMEHFNISSLGELKEDEQKTFFVFVDDLKEGLSAAQKKLPAGLQKAILAKQGKKDEKKEDVKEDLVGGQKKLDKDKDGDLDAKDFAMLRKSKGSMKKEYGMNMKASYHNKMKKEEKTKETDSEPKMKDLNAMHKDSHKSMTDKPMKDMNAGYMKSNVKAPVKDNGGADMASVKDAPDMKDAMKKINATYGMKKENNGNRYLQTKPGSLEEAVLKSRGLVK